MSVTETALPPTNRPYGPPSNVVSLLARLRSRNLPERINAEYLRDASISEGTVTRTLLGLRFLNLIDERGLPSDALKAIHTSTDEEYKVTLEQAMRRAYSDVFDVVDPSRDTPQQILNVFRKYTPASQRQRMVMFFLGMCREAGIPTKDESLPKARTQIVRPEPVRAHMRAVSPRARQGGATPQSDLSPALEALVRSLPTPGTALSSRRRDQWLAMARAALDFLYPEDAPDPAGEPEGDSDG